MLTLILIQASTSLTEAKAASSETNLVNLIVDGNETRTISDTTLKIEGRIEVRDNAILRLENVKVRFIESDKRHSVTVNNHSTLVLTESDIKIRVDVNQNSSLIASDSNLFYSHYCTVHGYNHTHGGVTGNADSNITLDGSKIGILWLHNNSQAQVTDSFIYWSYQEGGKLTVKDSKIQVHRENLDNIDANIVLPEFTEYTGELGEIIPGSLTYFENVSLIDGIWVHTNNSTITIHDSKFYFLNAEKGSNIILDNVTLSRIGNYWDSFKLSLNNSSIGKLFSYGSNDTITITGSRLEFIDLQSQSLELEITDSAVDELWMDDVWFKPFTARISHSTIGVFKPGLGNEEPNEYYMHNVSLLDGLGFRVGGYTRRGGINLHGGMRFDEGYALNETVVDGYAIINRFFPVYFNSSSGPVANVSLVLINGNRTLWEGETNMDGFAEVPVKFVNIFDLVRPYNASGASVIQADNMTEVVSLFWSYGDSEGSVELGLMSETPILVEVLDESSLRGLFVPLLVVLFIFIIINQNNK
jgi:hypothetical protein